MKFVGIILLAILGLGCSNDNEQSNTPIEAGDIYDSTANAFPGYDTLMHTKVDGLYHYDLGYLTFSSKHVWLYKADDGDDFRVNRFVSKDSTWMGIYEGTHPNGPKNVRAIYKPPHYYYQPAVDSLEKVGEYELVREDYYLRGFRNDSVDIWYAEDFDDTTMIEMLVFKYNESYGTKYHIFGSVTGHMTKADYIELAKSIKL